MASSFAIQNGGSPAVIAQAAAVASRTFETIADVGLNGAVPSSLAAGRARETTSHGLGVRALKVGGRGGPDPVGIHSVEGVADEVLEILLAALRADVETCEKLQVGRRDRGPHLVPAVELGADVLRQVAACEF